MLITKEMLKSKNACQDGLDWFVDRFPDGADHLDILYRLDREDTINSYGRWLLATFDLSGIYRRWHYNGQLAEQCEYINGEETGIYQYFSAKGQLLIQIQYSDMAKEKDLK